MSLLTHHPVIKSLELMIFPLYKMLGRFQHASLCKHEFKNFCRHSGENGYLGLGYFSQPQIFRV